MFTYYKDVTCVGYEIDIATPNKGWQRKSTCVHNDAFEAQIQFGIGHRSSIVASIVPSRIYIPRFDPHSASTLPPPSPSHLRHPSSSPPPINHTPRLIIPILLPFRNVIVLHAGFGQLIVTIRDRTGRHSAIALSTTWTWR